MVPDDIARQIEAEGGRVTFARFMELALTHPTEGYYSRSECLLGPRGHFSTAPRLSPVFNRAVARLLGELVDSWSTALATGASPAPPGGGLPGASPAFPGASPAFPGASPPGGGPPGGGLPPSVIELGGGEGDLAGAVLEAWEETRPDLRAQVIYGIVEIGDGLRARQNETLSAAMTTGWKVRCGTDLTEAAGGTRPCVIVGNEFCDALPVHVVNVRGARLLEAWVTIHDDAGGERDRGLWEVWDDISQEAEAELQTLFGTVDAEVLRPLSGDGFIEVRPALRSLTERISAVMPAGSLLTIDYGEWYRTSCRCDYPRNDAYGRTIRGYFRHQLVVDPYVRVGFQDLTADVDFRALDVHGREAGFETVLFTTVAALLRADGGEDRLSELLQQASVPTSEALEADREARVLEALLDPGGLGGAFKVMLQVRE